MYNQTKTAAGQVMPLLMGCTMPSPIEVEEMERNLADNYDAIEVGKTSDIPMDYGGVMGVPITFLDKFNPDQFEIVGATESEGKGFSHGLWKSESGIVQPMVRSERKYKRIFIRKRNPA